MMLVALVAFAWIELITSFLPALRISSDGYSVTANRWELASASDIVGLVLTVALTAAVVVRFLYPGLLQVRGLVAAGAAAIATSFVGGFEVMAKASDSGATVGAGVILSVIIAFGILCLLIAIVRADIASDRVAAVPARRVRLGLILAAAGGIALFLAFLLPADGGSSIWQLNTVTDMAWTLGALTLIAVASVALKSEPHVALRSITLTLASALALVAFSTAMDGLADGANGAASYVLLLIVSPALIASATLVGSAYPHAEVN